MTTPAINASLVKPTYKSWIAEGKGLVADIFFGQISKFLCIKDITNIIQADPRLQCIIKRIFHEESSLPSHLSLASQWFYNTIVHTLFSPNLSQRGINIRDLSIIFGYPSDGSLDERVKMPYLNLRIAMLNSSVYLQECGQIWEEPIEEAVKVGDLTAVEALIKATEIHKENDSEFAERIEDGNIGWLLTDAVRNGHTEIVKQFLRGVFRITSDRLDQGLEIAVESGYTEIVKLILQANLDTTVVETGLSGKITVTAEGLNSALGWAAGNGYTEIVKLILQANLDTTVAEAGLPGKITITAEGLNSALHSAAGNGYTEIAELILQANLDTTTAETGLPGKITVTAKGLNSALERAALVGQKEIVELLLQTTLADGRMVTVEGLNWGLRNAARLGKKEVVELLLQTTLADGNTVTVEGLGSALEATQWWWDRREIVKQLIEFASDSQLITILFSENQTLETRTQIIKALANRHSKELTAIAVAGAVSGIAYYFNSYLRQAAGLPDETPIS